MIQGIDYLSGLCDEMAVCWPNNRIVNIVCHGHSVPAGYFATPFVNTFSAYPHLLHRMIKERFPFAVVNVLVTAIGGEESGSGAARFERDVLTHNPDVVTIDYGLNDRGIGLEKAKTAWEQMIDAALNRGKKVILLTPSWDNTYYLKNDDWYALEKHRDQIIGLADTDAVGICQPDNLIAVLWKSTAIRLSGWQIPTASVWRTALPPLKSMYRRSRTWWRIWPMSIIRQKRAMP